LSGLFTLQDFPRGLIDGFRELVSDFIKARKEFTINTGITKSC
jgi:hypothetical protein